MRFKTLRRCLMLVVLIAAATSLVGMPSADACSPIPQFSVNLLDLVGADPSNPLAVVEDDYALWYEKDGEWADASPTPPVLVGAWYERTIAVVTGSENWFGDGGVTVVEQIWGRVPQRTHQRTYMVDNTSCAGESDVPNPGLLRLEVEGGSIGVRQPSPGPETAQAQAILTELFGAPVEPDRDRIAEQMAIDDAWRRAQDDGIAGELVLLESSEESASTPIGVARNGTSVWIWLAGALALVVGVSLAVWIGRPKPAAPEPLQHF